MECGWVFDREDDLGGGGNCRIGARRMLVCRTCRVLGNCIL